MIPNLDKNTEYIIEELNNQGFSAYAVGGCVRNAILGREVTDFDITTSALPEEIKTVFSAYPVIETGIKHGTVTVLIDRHPYEITTYRTEKGYSDSRHPDSVQFVTDIESDLSRRDFTVNAIAYSHKDGLVDPFGGMNDIKNKVLCAVGDPATRFSEDALRILRALRFASVLGFAIEEKTSEAIFALADTLSLVSRERVYVELKKLICGKKAVEVITKYRSVLERIIPINGDIESLSKLPPDYRFRLSALCGKDVFDALVALRADNETKRICNLLSESEKIPSDLTALKFYVSALGHDNALLVASYRRSLYNEDREELTEKLLDSNECLFIKDLAVNGKDLLNIGVKGEQIGEILNFLLHSVIEGKIDNTKESLLSFLLIQIRTM